MAGQPPDTVLIVDDDEAKRHAIAKILRKAGYRDPRGRDRRRRACGSPPRSPT